MVTSLFCTAVLFDLDGVLVYSADSIRRSWIRWAAAHGLTIEEVESAAHGRRAVDAIRQLAPHLNAEDAAREMDEAQALDTVGVLPVAGAQMVLSALSRQEWAVVTSGRRQLALARMQAAGLPEPPELVSAEDVAEGKPSPEGYLRAARLLGAETAECVVVEDAAVGIIAAHRAGMRVIGLATSGQAGQQLTGADAIVRSWADIVITRGRSCDALRPGLEVHARHSDPPART
jgi:mannitol-1-/sugar-/sorbitol-6-phosphatase